MNRYFFETIIAAQMDAERREPTSDPLDMPLGAILILSIDSEKHREAIATLVREKAMEPLVVTAMPNLFSDPDVTEVRCASFGLEMFARAAPPVGVSEIFPEITSVKPDRPVRRPPPSRLPRWARPSGQIE